MATLNVGAGQAYTTLAAAVAASRNGDVIAVQAGTYVNDFATISTKITIVGVGGMANFVATVPPPNGKGILVTQTDVTIENLSFSGAAWPTRRRRHPLRGRQTDRRGQLFPRQPERHPGEFESERHQSDHRLGIPGNGAGDGCRTTSSQQHRRADHRRQLLHTPIRPPVKSRAQSTTITNSRIYDGTGNGSYSIDLPNGGVAVIRDNVIEQGANSPTRRSSTMAARARPMPAPASASPAMWW